MLAAQPPGVRVGVAPFYRARACFDPAVLAAQAPRLCVRAAAFEGARAVCAMFSTQATCFRVRFAFRVCAGAACAVLRAPLMYEGIVKSRTHVSI